MKKLDVMRIFDMFKIAAIKVRHEEVVKDAGLRLKNYLSP